MSTESEAAVERLREAVEGLEGSHHELVETVRDLTRQGIDIDLLDGGSTEAWVNDLIAYAADAA